MKTTFKRIAKKSITLLLAVFLLLQPAMSNVLAEDDSDLQYDAADNILLADDDGTVDGDTLDETENDGEGETAGESGDEAVGIAGVDLPVTGYDLGDFETAVTITGVTLSVLKNGKWEPIKDYLENSASYVFGVDTMKLAYEFSLSATQVNDIRAEMPGAAVSYTVQVPIPAGLKYIYNGPATIKDNAGKTLGILEAKQENAGVFLHFGGDFWIAGEAVEKAGIEISCTLDTGEADDNNIVTVQFGALLDVEIPVGDSATFNHDLAKDGRYDSASRVVYWTVIYTPQSHKVRTPITFVDTFESDYQNIVIGSLRVKVGTGAYATVNQSDYAVSYGNNIGVITYVYKGALQENVPIEFQYQTQLTNDAFVDKIDVEDSTIAPSYFYDTVLNNSAKILSDDILVKEVTADPVTVTQEDKADYWLKKRVVSQGATTSGIFGYVINWEVTVRVYDFGLTNLKLHDTIPKGLELIENSVKITAAGLSKTAVEGTDLASTKETPPGGSGEVPVFVLDVPEVGGKYATSYTVTYSTRVSDEDLAAKFTSGVADPLYTNKAWLTFDLPDGPNPSTFTPPTVELKGQGIDARMVTKTGTYNTSDHTILWTVTVNPYLLDVVDGSKIVDYINKYNSTQPYVSDNHKYVTGSFNGGSYFTLTKSSDYELNIRISGLGTQKATFTYKTVATVLDKYEYNTTTYYYNTVEFNGTVKLIKSNGTSDLQPVTDSAQARATANSTVLTKTAGAYDYTSNIVTWTITVNSNAMPMTGAVVKDKIYRYQVVDPDSVSISPAVAGAKVNWNYTEADAIAGDTELVINLGNINQRVTITVKTRLLVDDDPNFKRSTSFKVYNDAVLSRNNLQKDQTITPVSKDITNNLVKKGGVVDSNKTQFLNYTVAVNPNGMDLSDFRMVDSLPRGVSLYLPKVAGEEDDDDFDEEHDIYLWEAVVSSSGVVTQKSPAARVDPSEYEFHYNSEERTFSIKFLKAKPYVLTYSCLIDDSSAASGTSFSNSVTFEGELAESISASDTVAIVLNSGWAQSHYFGAASLTIEKKDSKKDSEGEYIPLKGVVFELWTDLGETMTLENGTKISVGTKIDHGSTDADGKLTFYPINRNRAYWLIEVSGIAGYQNVETAVVATSANGEPIPLDQYTISFTSAGTNIVDVTIYNDRDTYNVGFVKEDTSGNGLKGAKFTLTDKDERMFSSPTHFATSGSDGRVTFGGVPFGEYILKETSAPTGYYLSEEEFSVVIKMDGNYYIKNSSDVELKNSRTGEGRIVNVPFPPVRARSTGVTIDPEPTRPPVPVEDTSEAVPTDHDAYIEVDDEEEPIKVWTFDEDKWEWKSSELVPTILSAFLELGDDEDPVRVWNFDEQTQEWTSSELTSTTYKAFLEFDNDAPTGVWRPEPQTRKWMFSPLIPTDDNAYLEIGEDGSTTGVWSLDELTHTWRFTASSVDDIDPGEYSSDGGETEPNGDFLSAGDTYGDKPLPQTGAPDLLPAVILLALLGMGLMLFGFILKRKYTSAKKKNG